MRILARCLVKRLACTALAGAGLFTTTVALLAQAPAAKDLPWAFPPPSAVVNKPPSPPIAGPQHVVGSTKSYSQEQIDQTAIAVDWLPEQHKPMPKIVRDGADDGGFACASCHLASGMGHPESADLAGLSKAYFLKTMREFRSGERKEPIRMTAIAQHLSEADMQEAATWFGALKPVPQWTRVVEAAIVPKTYLGAGRMRFMEPAGGVEPIGERIITVPQNVVSARARDPRSGFIAYVPPGSLARGKAIVQGDGGRSPPCAACHGPRLTGMGNAPGIAGVHPIYLVRQFYDFQSGTRNGPDAQQMKPIVAELSDKDRIAVAAYVGSLRR